MHRFISRQRGALYKAVSKDHSAQKSLNTEQPVEESLSNEHSFIGAELQRRNASALASQRAFYSTRDETCLHDAIQHCQAFVQLLTAPSTQRVSYYDNLAFLENAAFKITRSMKSLDDSIAHSKQAKDDALLVDHPKISELYHRLGKASPNAQ